MRAQVMFFVDDVPATSAWYQELFGLASGHGGPDYEQLVDGDRLLLELHRADHDHDHGTVTGGARGAGVILFMHVADVDAVHARAVAMRVEVVAPPHENELAGMRECTIRDPNGYTLSIRKSRWG